MYLSKQSILSAIKAKKIGITPFDEKHLGEASYELHLSDQLFDVKPKGKRKFFDGKALKEKEIHRFELKNDSFQFQPKQFIIGKTTETISLSEDYAGIFDGKASLAQIGLFVHISSTHIDPLTNSTITVELFNSSDYPILLKENMKIGQVLFAEVK
ncbi:MAG TPA: dCTP deaminase [bacterium]|nr:dCTP deaminase [bacterium]